MTLETLRPELRWALEAAQDKKAQSVTVLDRDTLKGAGVQHFEDVLSLVPDLNWAAGTSRPRFFQLRGIGEVEQYQGAPNPSVGVLIDDIDFSGVGMPATLFDAKGGIVAEGEMMFDLRDLPGFLLSWLTPPRRALPAGG